MTTRAKTKIIDDENILPEAPTASGGVGDGYERIELPDLPEPDRYFIRHVVNGFLSIPSGDKEIPELTLPPHSEQELPHHEFWLLHPTFRGRLAPREGPDGVMLPADVQLYKRVKGYKEPKAAPPTIAVDGQLLAHVQQIVYGPYQEAEEIIMHEPMMGPDQNIINVRLLAETWTFVLQHALHVLKDNKRCGKTVDARKIALCERRVAEIEELRRVNNIVVTR